MADNKRRDFFSRKGDMPIYVNKRKNRKKNNK